MKTALPSPDPDPRSERVAALLAVLDSPAGVTAEDAAARGWESFQRRRRLAAPGPRRVWGLRPAWLGAAACAALVGTLGFSPAARSATVRVLSLFRVEHVAALPLDLSSVSGPAGGESTMNLVRQMLSDTVQVTVNEKNQTADSAGQAAALAGYALRLPAGFDATRFRINGAKDFQMTVDRDRAQEILSEAGLVGVDLPASLDGSTVSVRIPRAVAAMAGDCALWEKRTERNSAQPVMGPGCTVFGESPSPTVSLPPGLDMRQIAEIGLQFLGMSAGEARQYCQTIDWTSTLVVPFPRNQAVSREVTVDGVSGILLVRDPSTDPGAGAAERQQGSHYVLLWSRQGMIYSVAGAGDGSQGLALAGQLPPQ